MVKGLHRGAARWARLVGLLSAAWFVAAAGCKEPSPRHEIRRRKKGARYRVKRGRPGPGPRVGPRYGVPRPVPRRRPAKAPDGTPFPAFKGAATRFTLLERGAGRKITLRYDWKPGLTACYRGRLQQITRAPRPLGTFQIDYDFGICQRALRVDKGIADVEVVLRDIAMRFPVSSARGTKPALRNLVDLRFLLKIDAVGKVMQFRPRRKLAGRLGRMLDAFSGNVARMNPRYPAVEIGVGARWEQVNVFPVVGSARDEEVLTGTLTNVYTVDGFTRHARGEAVALKYRSTVSVSGKTMGHTVEGGGKGRGKTVVLLDSGLAVLHDGQVKVTTTLQEHRSSNTTRLNMNLESLEVRPVEVKTAPGSGAVRPGKARPGEAVRPTPQTRRPRTIPYRSLSPAARKILSGNDRSRPRPGTTRPRKSR